MGYISGKIQDLTTKQTYYYKEGRKCRICTRKRVSKYYYRTYRAVRQRKRHA